MDGAEGSFPSLPELWVIWLALMLLPLVLFGVVGMYEQNSSPKWDVGEMWKPELMEGPVHASWPETDGHGLSFICSWWLITCLTEQAWLLQQELYLCQVLFTLLDVGRHHPTTSVVWPTLLTMGCFFCPYLGSDALQLLTCCIFLPCDALFLFNLLLCRCCIGRLTAGLSLLCLYLLSTSVWVFCFCDTSFFSSPTLVFPPDCYIRPNGITWSWVQISSKMAISL